MEEIWFRFVENLTDRISGPMKFRIFPQPVMASIFAIIAGVKDARTGKPPYFWALLPRPSHRTGMLRDGWKTVGKVFVLAMVLDAAYQFVVPRFLYPVEMLVVALLLAIVPYLLLRGLDTRVARRPK